MGKKMTLPMEERRIFSLDRTTVKGKERTVDLAFSSELPFARPWGIEILDHSNGSMRMSRAKDGLPLLWEHTRKELIGRLMDVRCNEDGDKKGRGTARFSRSALAEERWRDIEDGILKDVSVGYQIHMMQEMDPKDMPKDLMEMAAREKLPVYRITDWEPFECSLVTVPADPTVGVGRSKGTEEGAKKEEVKPPDNVITVSELLNEAPSGAAIISREAKKVMDEKTGKTLEEYEADVARERDKAAKSAKENAEQRVAGIYGLAKRFRQFIPDFMVEKAVSENMPLEEFQRIVLARVETGKPVDTPLTELGLSNSEVKRYSISRAILSQWKDSNVDGSFEMACHKEIQKRLGTDGQKGGIFVPYEVMRQPAIPGGTRGLSGQRDLTSGAAAAGGYLVGTDNLGSEFIDLLRNQMIIRRLGARVLSGLRGSITIPKRTVGVVSYWVGEATAPTEGAQTYGQLPLSPKNVGANLDYSRNLLLQSNPSIDGLVNGDLAESLALAVDLAAFHGSGAAGQPTGIAATSGIGTVTGTTIAYAGMLEFQTDIAAVNALASNCAYATTPAVAAILAQRHKAANTYSPLWTGGILETIDACGFRGVASNQITAGYMFFGDFSQVILAEWGVLELVVDPYTQSKSGIIQVTAFQSVDVGVRYPGAFSVSTSVT